MAWGIPTTTHEKSLTFPHRNAAFWNGLRMTMSMVIPAAIGIYLGYPKEALMMTLGTLVIGIADMPGTNAHRRNGMLIGMLVMVIAHAITVTAQLLPYTTYPIIVILTFLLSYMSIYGSRGSIIGASGMLAMVFALHSGNQWIDVLISPMMMMIGGLFYFLISLSFMQIRPYRIVQQSLGDSIQNIGLYLSARANLYSPKKPTLKTYRTLMKYQEMIIEEQDNVREILLKTRSAQRGTHHTARALVMIFSESVNIFEIAVSAHFDYSKIEKDNINPDFLKNLRELLRKIASELGKFGLKLSKSTAYVPHTQLTDARNETRAKLEELHQSGLMNDEFYHRFRTVLKQVKDVIDKYDRMVEYYNKGVSPMSDYFKDMKLHLFTQSQAVELKPFVSNLSIKSIHFRHALRAAICMLVAILAGYLIPHDNSYWLLLTVVVILRPNFSMTKRRMGQRVMGTIIGGLIGFFILSLGILPQWAIVILLALSSWGSFSFNALNYRTSVIFTTQVVLYGNYFIQPDFMSLIEFRMLDTIIGAGICISALYLIWPDFEYKNIAKKMTGALLANKAYFNAIISDLTPEHQSIVDYKLRRKDALAASTELSASFQRMVQDPKNVQYNKTRIYQFSVVNYMFMSHIASLGNLLRKHDIPLCYPEWTVKIEEINDQLQSAISIIDDGQIPQASSETKDSPELLVNRNLKPNELLVNNQLDYLYNLSTRLLKQATKYTHSK